MTERGRQTYPKISTETLLNSRNMDFTFLVAAYNLWTFTWFVHFELPCKAERDWQNSYRGISKFHSHIYSILSENFSPFNRCSVCCACSMSLCKSNFVGFSFWICAFKNNKCRNFVHGKIFLLLPFINLFRGHVSYKTKFGSDRFSRFDVY